MSSSITFYSVDAKEVAAACGSGISELLPEIKQSASEIFEYADEDDDPDLLGQVLSASSTSIVTSRRGKWAGSERSFFFGLRHL